MDLENSIFDTDEYAVRHYRRSTEDLVVSFNSLAGNEPGGNAEEFRHTLQSCGVSSIHIRANLGDWYNNDKTEDVFREVAKICRGYKNVGLTGQSMGACGALLFSTFFPEAKRVLVFAPQYAITFPYIGFDERYQDKARGIANHRHLDFGRSPAAARAQLVFGDLDWRDHIHASMFEAAGHNVHRIENGTHEVASSLKWSSRGNLLTPLMRSFCDYGSAFDTVSVADILRRALTARGIATGGATVWRRTFADQRQARPVPAVRAGLVNVAVGRTASQSSGSDWGGDRDPSKDAMGAVSGRVTGRHGFHTGYENEPWWQVDLGAHHPVQEVRIFNTVGSFEAAAKANRIKVEVADAPQGPWRLLHNRRDLEPFGGADGYPLVIPCDGPQTFRVLRITVMGFNCLHLDEVEIYEARPQGAPPPVDRV